MILQNAKQPENNISADNIFYVYDDYNKAIGKATTRTIENYTEFDSFPTNFYFDIHEATASDEALALLLGAVIAKGFLYSAQYPYHSTKIYTRIKPQNKRFLSILEGSGMQFGECEEEGLLYPPSVSKFKPEQNGCNFLAVPIETEEDIENLCKRLNQYVLSPISKNKVIQEARNGHRIRCATIVQNGFTISECAFLEKRNSSQNSNGEYLEELPDEAALLGLYTHPNYRRRGVATFLLSVVYKYLQKSGIQYLRCRLQRRSRSQKALAMKCNFRSLGISFFCPCISQVKKASPDLAQQGYPLMGQNYQQPALDPNMAYANMTMPYNPQMLQAYAQTMPQGYAQAYAQAYASQAYAPQVSSPEANTQAAPAQEKSWNDLYRQAYPSRRGKS